MINFLRNLSARSLGRTEDLKLVSPRLPSLFEPSTDMQELPGKATPWSPVTAQKPSFNHPSSVPDMNEEPVDFSIRHTQPEPPADNIAQAEGRLSSNHRNKLTDLARLERSAIKVETREPGKIEKNPPNPDRLPRDYSIRQAHPEPPTGNIPQVKESLADHPRNKSLVSYQNGQDGQDGQNGQEVRDSQEELAKTRPHRLDGHHLVIEDVMITKYLQQPSKGNLAEPEECPRPSKIISSEIDQWPGQDTQRHEAEGKEQPTINVTIGRIEVRATTAQLQNRPKAKGPALMSLEDYLKQRSGGKR